MLVLNPESVSLDSLVLAEVAVVAVDREPAAEGFVESWIDGGPFAVFADAPRRSVRITIRQRLTAGVDDGLRPGDQRVACWVAAPASGEVGRVRYRATAVVRSVRYRVEPGKVAERVIELVAVTGNPAADPLVAEAIDPA